MALDRVSSLPDKQPAQPAEGHHGLGGWLEDNVLVPAVNGSGLLQVYNTFASKPVELQQEKGNWAVQTLSGAAGAIIPYVVAGKITGVGMRAAGESLGLTGTLARFAASESAAQIMGAGLYEAAKKPHEGETRLGNAAATMVSFGVYQAGNSMLGNKALFENSTANMFARGAARFGIGAAGGLTAYETSHEVSSLLGVQSQTSWHDRISAAASGGFINVALPAVQEGISKSVNSLLNMTESYRGQPASRLLNDPQYDHPEIRQAIKENPFAHVRDVNGNIDSSALTDKNSILLNRNDGAPQAAHELQHLAVGKQLESTYRNIAKMIDTNPEQAEADYYRAREYSEFKARQAQNAVAARESGGTATPVETANLGDQPATGQRIYRQVWANDWEKFKADPTYRPTDYLGENGQTSGKPALSASADTATVAQKAPADGAALTYAPTGELTVNSNVDRPAGQTSVDQPGAVAGDYNKQTLDPKFTATVGATEPLGATVVTAENMPQPGATRDVIKIEGDHVVPETIPDPIIDAAHGKTGTNFAVFSEHAKSVNVLIFDSADAKTPSAAIPLTRGDGNVWNAFVEGLPPGTKYLYQADGSYTPQADGSRFNPNMALLDPYSRATTGDTPRALSFDNSNPDDPTRFNRMGSDSDIATMPKSIAMTDDFDWQGDKPLNHPEQDTHVYELNVKGFTANDASLGPAAGKYAGVVAKIPFLKKMGYTDVEFEPIAESDKALTLYDENTNTTRTVDDAWRYNPNAYMAPDGSFTMGDPSTGAQVQEMKWAIRELHKADIGVILDKVFNHTGEYGKGGPTISFKGLDNKVYYMLDPTDQGKYLQDHTGCGNVLNVNHPQVQKLIMDTLRYYVNEYHVDGFRFDLASVFNYDINNVDQPKTPIISAIENDPVLQHTKIVAEPWSTSNYKLGIFSDKRWGEWNGKYRDTVRRYVRGDEGQVGALADRIAGTPKGWKQNDDGSWSEWGFDNEKGRFSYNFTHVHDGQTRADTTAYQEKHNWANGEGNRDGTGDNFSWNMGVEGPTDDATINAGRLRQNKNFAAIQAMSLGVPITRAGDEMGHTTLGNNNVWQGDIDNINWRDAEQNQGLLDYNATMNHNRADLKIGHFTPADIAWHGVEPGKPDWSPSSHFLAWQFKPNATNPNSVYTASNSYWGDLTVHLPEGFNWRRVFDTNLPSGQDIVSAKDAKPLGGSEYVIKPRSVISFVGEPIKKQ